MIIETLKMGPWKITMNQVDYQPILSHRDFYTKYRLTHSICYFITIQKASEFGFAHRELRGASKRVEQLKIQYRSRWQARSNFRN